MSVGTLVSFAGSTIELVEHDREAGRLIRFVFGRFPERAPDQAHGEPKVRLSLASDAADRFALWRDGSPVFRATGAAQAVRLVLAEATHAFAVNAKGLLLHAAAVVHRGEGILLPASSGAGKSTLAAWLDGEGLACLSDEMVGIAEPGGRLVAFPRPVCLETDVAGVLPALLDRADHDGRLLRDETGLLVALPTPVPGEPVALRRLVFPRYVPGAPAALLPMSRGNAAIRLMRLVVSPLPDRGFAAAGSLTRLAPAFELTYGRLDTAVARLVAGSPLAADDAADPVSARSGRSSS